MSDSLARLWDGGYEGTSLEYAEGALKLGDQACDVRAVRKGGCAYSKSCKDVGTWY